MDILFLIFTLILGLLFVVLSQYIFEKNNITYVYIIYNIISFILSFKIIEVLKINISANIVTSTLATSITYLMIEKITIKEYKNLIKQVFFVNIFISIIILISSLYTGSVNDFNSVNMQNIFLNNYKILISYPIVTIINQIMILLIYNNIKDITENINLRIILTNFTTLMIETILFSIFSYIFDLEIKYILLLIISNYLLKTLLTLIYTPITSYIIKQKKVKL